MMSRSSSSRLETRSTRANKDELVKRVMLAVERVRKWEKKWVDAGIDGCTLKTYKWIPVVKDEITQVKSIPKDNLSDVSSNTSSPLPMEENNLNSGNVPAGQASVHKQPSNLLSGEPTSRHTADIYGRNAKPNVGNVERDRSFNTQRGKVGENDHGSATIGECDDSNQTSSIASEDSASLMYHLGMNVGGENDDSRQSVTDSENSTERKSPPAPSKDAALSFKNNLSTTSNTERRDVNEEPPTKRQKEDQQ